MKGSCAIFNPCKKGCTAGILKPIFKRKEV